MLQYSDAFSHMQQCLSDLKQLGEGLDAQEGEMEALVNTFENTNTHRTTNLEPSHCILHGLFPVAMLSMVQTPLVLLLLQPPQPTGSILRVLPQTLKLPPPPTPNFSQLQYKIMA